MCRYDPITKTERRCPSYLDKATYNAKRRSRYHAKKNSNSSSFIAPISVSDKDTNQTLMQNSNYVFNENLPIFSANIQGLSLTNRKPDDTTKPYSVSDDYETVDSLNVQIREATGSFASASYFNQQIFQGQIDHTQLDENSYKVFFSPMEESIEHIDYPGQEATYFSRENVPVTDQLDTFVAISRLEVQQMTEEEKGSLKFFTSNNYSWFNKAMYSDGENLTTHEDDAVDLTAETFIKTRHSMTNATKVMKALDSALAKGPKIQRTLYRGVTSTNKMFEGTTPAEWASEINLGQELIFDGYQSATQNFSIANGYSNNDGVIFEIITPEGVQIASCSQFDGEKETLLPRDSRYQVVGVHKEVIGEHNNPYGNLSVIQLVAINSKGEILDGTNSDKPKPVKFKKAKN